MQRFRRKSSATIRPSSSELASSSPPSPSPSQENPSIPHRLFRRKSAANIRPSEESNSSGEASPSVPRRLFRRKSSATIRPSTANSALLAHDFSPSSPHSYTSPASPPPIPAQFVQYLPIQSPPELPTIANLTNPPSSNRVSNRFSTTSTLFEREIPAPQPPARLSPLAPVQQSRIEEYVAQAGESDLHRLGQDAMMALAWVQAEERRRAITSRGWQQDPWRGGFGPSASAERVRPVPVLRVETVIPTVQVETPVRNVASERSGNGLRERLGRKGLMKSQSIFNLKWRVRDVA